MINHFVLDTNCLISYFAGFFDSKNLLSPRIHRVISQALVPYEAEARITIPSVVFIELFEKWHDNEDFISQLYYEVYLPIIESPNFEIREIDKEVLEVLPILFRDLGNHDINDKLILATAIVLGFPLITCDPILIRYLSMNRALPSALN